MRSEIITALITRLDEKIGSLYDFEALPVPPARSAYSERWCVRFLVRTGVESLDVYRKHAEFLLSDRRGHASLKSPGALVVIDDLTCDFDAIYMSMDVYLKGEATEADMAPVGDHLAELFEYYVKKNDQLPDVKSNPTFVQDLRVLEKVAMVTMGVLETDMPAAKFYLADENELPDTEGIIYRGIRFTLGTGWRVDPVRRFKITMALRNIGLPALKLDTDDIEHKPYTTGRPETLLSVMCQLTPMSDNDITVACESEAEFLKRDGVTGDGMETEVAKAVCDRLDAKRLAMHNGESWPVVISGKLWVSDRSHPANTLNLMRKFFDDLMTLLHDAFSESKVDVALEQPLFPEREGRLTQLCQEIRPGPDGHTFKAAILGKPAASQTRRSIVPHGKDTIQVLN